MDPCAYRLFSDKVIIRLEDHITNTADSVLDSGLCYEVVQQCIDDLATRNSRLLNIFDHRPITADDVHLLIQSMKYILKVPLELVPKVVPQSEQFFRDPVLLRDFVEQLYNHWRTLQRLVILDSQSDRFDRHPYRAFHNTIEALTHLVRSIYRDIQERITGSRPRIYRQVRSGAEVGTIVSPKDIPYPADLYRKLNTVPVIRQVLIYPPLIFTPPMNKRSGMFEAVAENPLTGLEIRPEEWLCYPAKVGPLVVMIYFSINFFELGFTLSNLFELADDSDLMRNPDAIFLYGVPDAEFKSPGSSDTIFYEDQKNDVLVGVVPERPEFAYFGYLKKMVLTLHNIKMMRMGRMPYHGALLNLTTRHKGTHTILIMGDTGAGKSETIEALRQFGKEEVEDITIIADDMGSLIIEPDGTVMGYGTETGAFVRLDDLQPGYAFGQIDRTIIMSPNQTNARVVLPVTTFENVIKGFAVDMVLYANNYEAVDEQHPVIDRFRSVEDALEVFRAGAAMSKGTTTNTGLGRTFYANVFGPAQFPEMYEKLAQQYFGAMFDRGVFVGQMRTELGLAGSEQTGPLRAARALLASLGE